MVAGRKMLRQLDAGQTRGCLLACLGGSACVQPQGQPRQGQKRKRRRRAQRLPRRPEPSALSPQSQSTDNQGPGVLFLSCIPPTPSLPLNQSGLLPENDPICAAPTQVRIAAPCQVLPGPWQVQVCLRWSLCCTSFLFLQPRCRSHSLLLLLAPPSLARSALVLRHFLLSSLHSFKNILTLLYNCHRA